ncbi:protein EMBRYO DEFECTIVE 514-like [Vicia villosa]|uniref:protein EMBRYO DEFECTIVE 514-like n=1 Tax=Vicia villosa TaxID=3911 RepID=UPI00273A89B6|nr:protein EMBRYO DEFECTIVE 514-like [Vicia villosa]
MAEETAPQVVDTATAVVDTNNTDAPAADTTNTVAATVDMEVENPADSKDKRPREEEEPKEDDIVSKKAKVDEEKSVEEQRLEKLEKKEDEEVKEVSVAVKLGPKTFGSSLEMFHYFHKFLNAWPHNLNVNKYEHTMLLELLKNGHAESEKKIGAGVCAFQVREHPRYNSRCYFLIREDDTADDFSFRKCVDHISPLPEGMQLKSEGNKRSGGGGGNGGRGRGGRGGGRGGRGRGGRGRY